MSLLYFEGANGVYCVDANHIVMICESTHPEFLSSILLDCDPVQFQCRNSFDDLQAKWIACRNSS